MTFGTFLLYFLGALACLWGAGLVLRLVLAWLYPRDPWPWRKRGGRY